MKAIANGFLLQAQLVGIVDVLPRAAPALAEMLARRFDPMGRGGQYIEQPAVSVVFFGFDFFAGNRERNCQCAAGVGRSPAGAFFVQCGNLDGPLGGDSGFSVLGLVQFAVRPAISIDDLLEYQRHEL